MSLSISKILDVTRSEIGTKASSGQICKYNTSFYGSAIGGDWCCSFVWDRFHSVGADSLLNGKTANCGQLALNFKKAGRLYSNKSVQVGDIVLFHWSNDRSTYVPEYYTCDHVGIVEAVNGDTITTIEGNTDTNSYPNGIVARKTRSLSRYVSCVCRPTYYDSPEPVKPDKTFPDVIYKVRTCGKWLPEVKNLEDYAGIIGSAITDVAIKATNGLVKYRVHIKEGEWLPYVTGYDVTDDENGYAGDNKPIDAIEVYYNTPQSVVNSVGYLKAKYRVSAVNSDYYDYQYDDEKSNGQDGYAGNFGKSLDKLQIELVK